MLIVCFTVITQALSRVYLTVDSGSHRSKLEASKCFRPSTAVSVDNGGLSHELSAEKWFHEHVVVGPKGGMVAFSTECFYFQCEMK